jgi:Flp pilus assembly pilin Flp
MLNQLKQFATSLFARVAVVREEGQALVEYALIIALVGVAAVIALGVLSGDINALLEEVGGKL